MKGERNKNIKKTGKDEMKEVEKGIKENTKSKNKKEEGQIGSDTTKKIE